MTVNRAMHAPELQHEQTDDGDVLRLRGCWCIDHLPGIDALLASLRTRHDQPLRVEASGLSRLDSAGVMLLVNRLRAQGVVWSNVSLVGFEASQRVLIELMAARLDARPGRRPRPTRLLPMLGRQVTERLRGGLGALTFLGQIAYGLRDLARRPSLLRHRELTTQLEMVGLGALPIIAMMTFLVGVVFAFLLGIQAQKFGANIFVVDGIGLAVTRELAPLLTAILVAGRSGAAFTAQIGAMRVTEEIDAIATLGLSPIQVLVLPRLFAIVLTLPLLTFIGDIMGILGAAMVAASQLDISFHTFFARLRDTLPFNTLLFGLSKAPVFAAAIAIIACRNGFAVQRDARSVGEYTTATVVQSLIAVILINALFAVAYPEIT